MLFVLTSVVADEMLHRWVLVFRNYWNKSRAARIMQNV